MSDDLKVTPAREWRATVLVELPSGQVARLRSVTTTLFNRMGKIPDAVTAWIYQQTQVKTEGTAEEIRESRLDWQKRLNNFEDEVCIAAFAEPRLVRDEADADENSLWILDLDERDRAFVFNFYNKPLEELKSFRPEQAGDVEPVQPESEVPSAPKRPVRNSRLDKGKAGV